MSVKNMKEWGEEYLSDVYYDLGYEISFQTDDLNLNEQADLLINIIESSSDALSNNLTKNRKVKILVLEDDQYEALCNVMDEFDYKEQMYERWKEANWLVDAWNSLQDKVMKND